VQQPVAVAVATGLGASVEVVGPVELEVDPGPGGHRSLASARLDHAVHRIGRPPHRRVEYAGASDLSGV